MMVSGGATGSFRVVSEAALFSGGADSARNCMLAGRRSLETETGRGAGAWAGSAEPGSSGRDVEGAAVERGESRGAGCPGAKPGEDTMYTRGEAEEVERAGSEVGGEGEKVLGDARVGSSRWRAPGAGWPLTKPGEGTR